MLNISTKFSRYEVVEQIGAGAMAEVYKAFDEKLQRFVALKVFNPSFDLDDTGKQRFFQEAWAVSKLEHPNICTVHDINETPEGHIFIVLPYYPGGTLKKKIPKNGMKPASALEYSIQIASGLAHAHHHKIVHRDIKPVNIMFTEGNLLKVVDFGIAKCLNNPPLTCPGLVLGTIAYMSPEQAEGLEVNHQTDIWALGILFFEMLTGQIPYEATTEEQLYDCILCDEPTPLRQIRPEFPVEVEKVLKKALSQNRSKRFDSMEKFQKELIKLRKHF